MSKDDSANEKRADSDNSTPEADALTASSERVEEPDQAPESGQALQPEEASEPESEPEPEPEPEPEVAPEKEPRPKARRSWMGAINFLLILGLAGAAGYYWQQQQLAARAYEETVADIRQQLDTRATRSSVDSEIAPVRTEIGQLGDKIDRLEFEQQGLRESSEKLYELYGRDKNDWQLAEVEYLMRVAQHKLSLEDDFEGAAVTLQAASDKIALTGDPGLLPVRVLISEEIADLKTRKRPDLVGMTLILAQLGRQLRVLQPGFTPRVDSAPTASISAGSGPSTGDAGDLSWRDRLTNFGDSLSAFVDSLVEIRHEATEPSEIEAGIADVGETLEDNLKLARWAVLDRDASQYQLLIDQSLRLFREYYDLDDAANHDFLTQLQSLQKTALKPQKPDIEGSLRELQRILSVRENAPQQDAPQQDAPQQESPQSEAPPETAPQQETEPTDG